MSASITKTAIIEMYAIDAARVVAVHMHEQALHSMVAPHVPASEPQHEAAMPRGADMIEPIRATPAHRECIRALSRAASGQCTARKRVGVGEEGKVVEGEVRQPDG